MEKDRIRIRDFEEPDLALMLRWLTDARVLEFYGGRDLKYTYETIAGHYNEALPDGFRVIIEYDGKPIGYGQIYRLSGELLDEYACPDDGLVTYAMDQFIGEPWYWGRGIGSSFLMLMTDYLKRDKGARRVLLDPHKSNPRAIRAYEKAGFTAVKDLPGHELFEGRYEDCLLMEKLL